MWQILLLLSIASAQPIVKTTTSQYPYGSCGIKNKNQINPAISPYQSPLWSSSDQYHLLNLTKPGCRDRAVSCTSAPCIEFCKEALIRVDAFHIPINSACLQPNIRVSPKACTALVATNYPGSARYRTSSNAAWSQVSLDLNSCDGTVTQARINTKGISLQATDRWIQFAISKSMFSCPWKQVCRSANIYSNMSFCAVVPYLNSGKGGHAFCPVIPSIVA